MKGQGGRPALPADQKKDRAIQIKVTRREKALLDAWSRVQGRALGDLLRSYGLRQARRAGIAETETTTTD